MLRDLVDLAFFLKVSDYLLVSCLFADTGLAESVPRARRCLVGTRLDGQKPSETWEGVCKAGSAVGSVEGGRSSCTNFTPAVVVTLEASGERTQKKKSEKRNLCPPLV